MAQTFAADIPSSTVPTRGWQASSARVSELEGQKVPWLFLEKDVPAYALPDPLLCSDGTRVTTVEQWERRRRGETLELFRKYVYGRSPQVPAGTRADVVEEDPMAMEGKALKRRIRFSVPVAKGSPFTFDATLMLPKRADGRVPLFLLINNRGVDSADPTRVKKAEFWPAEELIERGYATAVFQTRDVQPDEKDGLSRGLVGAMEDAATRQGDSWATIAAWSWAASRVMDYLQTVNEVDAKRVAVIGHSRGGKTALWTGAQDTRFSLVISNDSGCAGAALSRRCFGETVETINRNFPHWFCSNFKTFNVRENELPVDQHQLIALIAPRAVCVASADEDLWADPRGEFLSLANAGPVYRLYGLETIDAAEMPALDQSVSRARMSYHIRAGGHGLTLADWRIYMDFADRLWKHK